MLKKDKNQLGANRSRVELARAWRDAPSTLLREWTVRARHSLAADGTVHRSLILSRQDGTKFKYPWGPVARGISLERFIEAHGRENPLAVFDGKAEGIIMQDHDVEKLWNMTIRRKAKRMKYE